jgi:hypothetical protein
MFQTILIGLALVVLSAIGYVLVRAYLNKSSKKEEFQAALTAKPVPAAAPAPIAAVSPEPPQVTMPAGPNPPSAAPPKKVTFAPETQPRDPYDQPEGEQPMRDSLRHPERSFGPGVDNTNTRIAVDAGVASAAEATANASFSPEFAQNGGEFMSGILANDAYGEAVFANA